MHLNKPLICSVTSKYFTLNLRSKNRFLVWWYGKLITLLPVYYLIVIKNCCFRELTSKDPRSELGYRLTVMVDTHDPARPLSVVHVPTLGNKVGVSVEVSQLPLNKFRLQIYKKNLDLVFTNKVYYINFIGVFFTTILSVLFVILSELFIDNINR